MDNYKNRKERWAIRSILSIVQQGLILEDRLSKPLATEFINGLEDSKKCAEKYFSNQENAKQEIDKALGRFFEFGNRKSIFNNIKRKIDSDFGIGDTSCYIFSPPIICGESGNEKCEL